MAGANAVTPREYEADEIAGGPDEPSPQKISDQQQRKFWAIARARNQQTGQPMWSEEQIRALLGDRGTADIVVTEYDALVEKLKRGPSPQGNLV